MYNTKTLIRSSIVSLLIVAFGLFLLCVSTAPRIETNESAAGSRDGGNDANLDNDQSLLALLNEADQEIGPSETTTEELSAATEQSDSEVSNSDDELASLLSEADNAFAGDVGAPEEKTNDELMQLLEADDQSQSESIDNLQYTSLTEADPSTQPEEDLNQLLGNTNDQSQDDAATLAAINDEIKHLESVLSEKNSVKERLKEEIKKYDERIAMLESRLTNPVSEDNYYSGQQTTTDYGYSETSESGNIALDTSKPIDDYEITYKDALQLFYDHRYGDAINQFYALLQVNPKHKLADNCQYWLGECYYAQGKYYQAIAEFNKVAAYDAADKKDDAQLMLGLCFLKLGDTELAQTELNWLVGAFAKSEYVSKAYRYLNRL